MRFPDKVKRAAPIAGTAKNTPHDFIYAGALRSAFKSDPGFNGGWYESAAQVRKGQARQALLWCAMGFSTEFWKQEHWRNLGLASAKRLPDRLPGRLLRAHGPQQSAVPVVEVATRGCKSSYQRRSDRGVRPDHGKDVRNAHQRGHVFPVRGCEAEQALIAEGELRVIDSISGHLGLFGLESTYMEQVDQMLRDLLDQPV